MVGEHGRCLEAGPVRMGPVRTSCSMCRICRLGGTPSKRAAARNLRKVVLPTPLRPTSPYLQHHAPSTQQGNAPAAPCTTHCSTLHHPLQHLHHPLQHPAPPTATRGALAAENEREVRVLWQWRRSGGVCGGVCCGQARVRMAQAGATHGRRESRGIAAKRHTAHSMAP